MDQETLKKLRLLVPGGIMLFGLIPLLNFFQVDYKIDEGWLSYSFVIVGAGIIGIIYEILDARHFITNLSHRRIDLNISSSLLLIYSKKLDQDQQNYLKERRLKHIFYNIIDSSESLKTKSKLVYFNGFLWTTTADFTLISLLLFFIYSFCGIAFIEDSNIWSYVLYIIIICFLSIVLHFLTIIKHFNLSNDQLEYMETHHLQDIRNSIERVLQQMSSPDN